MKKILFKNLAPEWAWNQQTPNKSLNWGDCHFYLENSEQDYDFCFIFCGIEKTEKFYCPKDNIYFISGEPPSVLRHNINFLKQFNSVISVDKNIKHKNLINHSSCHPWFIGRKVTGNNTHSFNKSYDILKNNQNDNKEKIISIITSDKTFTEGHKKRYDFAMKLKEYFGDKIDIFGRGINDIEDKWDAIAPYKYHIAIENSCFPHYWTEKLSDSFLSLTYPIYYGCNNLNDYFPSNSYSYIDINDINTSIDYIKHLINNKTYEKNFNSLIDAKNICLDKYNLFAYLSDIVEKKYKIKQKKSLITILPENIYLNKKEYFKTQFKDLFNIK